MSDRVSYYHISIADNRVGFDENYADLIFKLFKTLQGTDDQSGTGLGLTIAKRIVENHGGLITARGKLNEGATFDIYIPVEGE
ncbi:MAG: ATP-binding protein [Ferruginibacter sp.]